MSWRRFLDEVDFAASAPMRSTSSPGPVTPSIRCRRDTWIAARQGGMSVHALTSKAPGTPCG